MLIITLVYLLIVCWGLGYTLTFWKDSFDDFSEALIMRIAIGLAALPLLGAILNVVSLPIHWVLILILALIFPVYKLIKEKFSTLKTTPKIDLYQVLVLIFFGIILVTMVKGSFIYPWFEDTDPYSHATATRMIATLHTFSKPVDMYVTHYAEPYPQGMPIVMGILHQIEPSISTTLKFFNAFIVSISILFFYYFTKLFTKNAKIAVYATGLYAALPSAHSHFIYSQSYGLTLFFPALYALLLIKNNKWWILPSAIAISGVLLTQQLTSVVLALFLGSLALVVFYNDYRNKNYTTFWRTVCAIIFGGVFAFAFFYIPEFYRFSSSELQHQYTLDTDPMHKSFFNFVDSASVRFLTLTDFVHPCIGATLFGGCPKGYPNKTDNATGFGAVIFILLLIGIIYAVTAAKKILNDDKDHNKLLAIGVTVLWLLFTILGSIGDYLPFKILPNRWWAFLSIPVALLAAYGILNLIAFAKAFKIPSSAVLIVIVLAVSFTSFWPKYTISTSIWMPHVYEGQTEIVSYLQQGKLEGYLWLKTLPPKTPVFDFCMDDDIVIASDAAAFPWDKEVKEYKSTPLVKMMNTTIPEFSSWLKQKSFKYVTINARCSGMFGQNETIARINALQNSGLLRVAHNIQGFIAWEIM